MDRDAQRKAICDAVPKSAEFSADDMAQMNRLLLVCQAVLADDENSPSLSEQHTLLASLKNGYSCWLDTVQGAILNTNIGDPHYQAALFGSFRMAGLHLLALDWAREGGPPRSRQK